MAAVSAPLPRVTIQFCTQCKWMLRAAYFAQELLSTFNTALGEVALQPSTGGTFIVSLYSAAQSTSTTGDSVQAQCHVLWDRKAEGGFPETKELKRRVRDIIEPGRDLGHVDGKKNVVATKRTVPKPELDNLHDNRTTDQGEEIKDPEKEPQQPNAIPNSSVKEQGSKGGFISVDVDNSDGSLDPKNMTLRGKINRHPDGTMCEDCI